MKQVFILIVVMFFFSFASNAQEARKSRNELQGPKAKNYKYWKGKVSFKPVDKVESLQGPKAKNYKPYQENVNWETASAKKIDHEKYRKPKGPKAKNFKYWKK